MASFFEESRIKALSLQKDGETALLLFLKLLFSTIREDSDEKLMLYGNVPTVYGVPVTTVKVA